MDEKEQIMQNREFMKSGFGKNEYVSDQQKLLPQPPLVKPAMTDNRIPLTMEFDDLLQEHDYLTLLRERKSNRFFADQAMSLKQLSFLLWSTQGIRDRRGNNYATLRPVPSGGARHAFETYLAVMNVEGLEPGVYHYLPIEHALEQLSVSDNMRQRVIHSACDQKWAGNAAVDFIYAAVAYRAEWRYSIGSHRVMLIDAGHIVQNLYLSSQAIGCGTCAIAAFRQEETDAMLGIDGKEEYTVYMAPVGIRDDRKNEENTKKLYANV